MLGSSPFEGVDTPPKGLRNQPASSSGDWVRVASALFIHGFDVGRDLQMSWLGDEVKAALEAKLRREGKFLVDDVHGLLVYEEQGEPVRLALSAAPIVVEQSSIALENVLAIASGSTLTDEQSLACDLVSLAEHEGSDRARFLILVTAIEVLAERSERAGGFRTVVERFIEEAKRSQTEAGRTKRVDIRRFSAG